jgi:hypothetical protein
LGIFIPDENMLSNEMIAGQSFAILFLVCSLLSAHVSVAQSPKQAGMCSLPAQAEVALLTKFPDWKIPRLSDLSEHDRKLWSAKRPGLCPGIAKGHYFPSGNPAYAVTLYQQNAKTLQTLIVLKPKEASYELIELTKPAVSSRIMVVFRLKPATFENIEMGEKTKSAWDAIAYEDIAAGMLVYTWSDGKFKEIQVSE